MPLDLPKQYDHLAAQERWYKFWEERGYFHSEPRSGASAKLSQAELGNEKDKGPFAIVIPPPNVTGALHLGHALNNTLQDIVIRFKRMQGYNTLWMPGTDHAGIATQAVVERRLLEEEGKTRHDLGREELVRRIWAWKDEYEKRIIGQLKQMGCSCDWARTRFTLDEICARAVRQTFFDFFKAGLIFRGKRLVNWDTFLQTAVADDEIYTEEVKGGFWTFKYPVKGHLPLPQGEGRGEGGAKSKSPHPNPLPEGEGTEYIRFSTTRPETMLGDTAVAVHPNDPRYKHLIGKQVTIPLVNRDIPIIGDGVLADPELGTGCVKVTPAHDPNDYECGLRNKLPMINILNPDGTINENGGKFAGLDRYKAREAVTAEMERLGLFEGREDRMIPLKFSDRSKTPIEPYLSEQWFVRMGDESPFFLGEGRRSETSTVGLAEMSMQAVRDRRVTFIPERYAKSYLDWLGEKRDWCISRQLWWGHRIPVWTRTKRVNLSSDEESKYQTLDQRIDEWERKGRVARGKKELTGQSLTDLIFSPRDFVCVLDPDDTEVIESLEQDGLYVQDPDVLDTWFSSALWPHSTLGWPEKTPELEYYYPTSALITSRDIITLWVARMVLTGLFNMEDVPFRQVYITTKILDGYGETMSKSKGNGVDPLDIIEKSGADALRFGIAYLATETQDVRMPVEFECPHCQELIEQTKQNRLLPRVKCPKCKKDFATQWASKPEDKALPRGLVVSERFELGRNFCNKLWNASRFALLNLEGYTPGVVGADSPRRTAAASATGGDSSATGVASYRAVADKDLAIEDRWILSRLATVTRQVTEALERYGFADAARALYDFAWDEFCSFYIEMAKYRLQNEATRPVAQRVLAHTLDVLLRLLHPMIPFLTEEVWQLLGQAAPQRGLQKPEAAAESIMIAPWPEADLARQDATIEARFARFQEVLRGVREIRSRQNIQPKTKVDFVVRCDGETAKLLRPMEPYFGALAGADARAMGPDVTPPSPAASFSLPGLEVFVDLAGVIDVKAELSKYEKERHRLGGLIDAKEKKLANEKFLSGAPAEVVQKERDALAKLHEQLQSVQTFIEQLQGQESGDDQRDDDPGDDDPGADHRLE